MASDVELDININTADVLKEIKTFSAGAQKALGSISEPISGALADSFKKAAGFAKQLARVQLTGFDAKKFDITQTLEKNLEEIDKFEKDSALTAKQAADLRVLANENASNDIKKIRKDEAEEAQKSIKETVSVFKKASNSFKKFGSDLGNAFKSVGKAIFSVQTLVAGVVGFLAVGKLVGFVKDVTAAASVQEDAINQLNTALRLTGDFTAEASKDMQAFASELQQNSKLGDEVILSQLALAKSFGATNDQAKQLVSAAADLAAATGQTLEFAVRNLGKTFGGLTGELGEVVPDLKNLSKEALESGAAIDFINKRFGGSAQAEIRTFSGAVAQLGNIFGDFQEEIGKTITESPAIIAAVQVFSKIFTDLGKVFSNQRGTVTDFLDSFVTGLVKAIPAVIRKFADLIKGLKPVAAAMFAVRDAVGIVLDKVAAFAVGVSQIIRTSFNVLTLAVKSAVTPIAFALNKIGAISDETFKSLTDSIKEDAADIGESVSVIGESISDIVSSSETDTDSFDSLISGINKVADGAEKTAKITEDVIKEFDELKAKAAKGVDVNVNIKPSATPEASIVTSLAGVADKFAQPFEKTATQISQSLGIFAGEKAEDVEKVFAAGVSVAGKIGDAIGGAVGAIISLFDPENIKRISAFFGEFLAELPVVLVDALGELGKSLDKFLEKFPAAVTKALEKLPDIFSKIFARIPAIISALSKAFGQLLDQLPKIIGSLLDRLPQIIESVLSNLGPVIEKLLGALGKIIANVIRIIPGVIVSILDGLPDVLESLLVGLGEAGGDIAIGFIDFLADGGVEKIAEALIRALPRIIVGVIRGAVRSTQSILQKVFSPDGFRKLFESIGPNLRKAFGDAFNSLDPSIFQRLFSEGFQFDPSVFDALFTEVGNIMGLGFLQTIQDNAERIGANFQNAIGNVFDNIFDSFIGKIAGALNIPVPQWLEDLNKLFTTFRVSPEWLEKLRATVGKLSTTPGWLSKFEETVRKLSGADIGGDLAGGGGGGGALKTVATGGLNKIAGFAQGGVIPPGFPNDSAVIRVSSGETITPAGQTPGGNEMMALASILQRIEAKIGGGNQNVNLSLDGEVLASAILGLNQNNARLA